MSEVYWYGAVCDEVGCDAWSASGMRLADWQLAVVPIGTHNQAMWCLKFDCCMRFFPQFLCANSVGDQCTLYVVYPSFVIVYWFVIIWLEFRREKKTHSGFLRLVFCCCFLEFHCMNILFECSQLSGCMSFAVEFRCISVCWFFDFLSVDWLLMNTKMMTNMNMFILLNAWNEKNAMKKLKM